MKKKLLITVMALAMTLSFAACSEKKAENDTVSSEQTESPEQSAKEEDKKDDTKSTTGQTSLKDFSKGFDMLSGEEFEVLASYAEGEGITTSVKGRNGSVGCFLTNGDATLVTIDYENDTNELYIASYGLDEKGEVEGISVLSLDDAIFMSDNARVCAGTVSFLDITNALMIEFRGDAYTYADGITYRIALIEISEDGHLSLVMDKGLAGSGDEDITSDLRAEFNGATGFGVSQREMEVAFYYGNLLLTQYDATIVAGYHYQSEAAKFSDAGDWDKASENATKLYDLSSGDEVITWAVGTFE